MSCFSHYVSSSICSSWNGLVLLDLVTVVRQHRADSQFIAGLTNPNLWSTNWSYYKYRKLFEENSSIIAQWYKYNFIGVRFSALSQYVWSSSKLVDILCLSGGKRRWLVLSNFALLRVLPSLNLVMLEGSITCLHQV